MTHAHAATNRQSSDETANRQTTDDSRSLASVAALISATAQGTYQSDLLKGLENWSGSSLLGKARTWSASYYHSRRHLLRRIQEALAGTGWSAGLGYVLMGDPRRYHLRLILTAPDGRVVDQVTGDEVGRRENQGDVGAYLGRTWEAA